MMTSRERFLAVLNGETPDRTCVFDQIYHQDLYEKVLQRRPFHYDNLDAVEIAHALGLDAALVIFDNYPGIAAANAGPCWLSEWQVTYRLEADGGAGWPTGMPVACACDDRSTLMDFSPPKLNAAQRFATVEKALARAHELDLAVVAGLRGPFALLMWHFLGMEAGMLALGSGTSTIPLALEHYRAFHLSAAAHLAALGVDAVFLTEDLGTTAGPLISPAQYRDVFGPTLRDIVGELRKGTHVILHSDGDVRAYLPDLLAAGISALHPIERSAHMCLHDLSRQYGDRLTLCGNVDTKTVLSKGTPADVRIDVERCLREAGAGRHILCSDHSLSNGYPIDNILEMIRAARELGVGQ